MAVNHQTITENYALYHGDSCEVLQSIPGGSIHLSCYSPPFATDHGGLYQYSSRPEDLSNSRTYSEFFDHYRFIVEQMHRVTLPGRVSAVHCADVPEDGANIGGVIDFSGDIIRLHREIGWEYIGRHCVWKEPLGVRNRTMAKGLAHRQIVEDSAMVSLASADYILIFRKKGKNPIPVTHPRGLTRYAGERNPPADVLPYRMWSGNQIENKYSHWIWRQYASSNWDDVRIKRVVPYEESKDEDDERHMHPLQLDVIERIVVLRSNEGETLLTPFMGVGSEVYGALINGRKGVGIELKNTFYRQAVKNCASAHDHRIEEQEPLFAGIE